MGDTASAPEIRAARAFLVSHQIKPNQVSPARFAASAKEMNVGFRELLRVLGLIHDKGRSDTTIRRQFLDRETQKLRSLRQVRKETPE